MKSKFLIAAIFLAVSIAASAQQSYLLRLRPVVGKTYTLFTTLTGPLVMSITTPLKVVKESDNRIVFIMRFSGMTKDGKSMMAASPKLKTVQLTMTADSTGHMVSTEVSGVSPEVAARIKSQTGSGNFVTLPSKPVKVGDSWVGEYIVSSQKLPATYKFVGLGVVRGIRIANLTVNVKGQAGATTLNNPIRTSVELSTGMIVDSTFSISQGDQKETVKVSRT